MTFKPGAVIGGYLVLSQLGMGGMGRVFLAEDKALARKVALKILPPEDSDEEGRARFLREAQALARVQHKNVVQVFASGVDEDVAWMALEYVEGDPLGALVDGVKGVDEETALSLCSQAARGLAAVHAVGVVHRDVKPDNLLLDAEACLRVLDFGVALFVDRGGMDMGGRGGFVTQKGVAVGTPHYMAPEQARGGAIDARADAWGLGATLYTLLAGRPPFYGRDDEADLDILARVLREQAPNVRARAPEVSDATARLVARMLDPDRDKRLADMNEVADLCDQIADAIAQGIAPAPIALPPPDPDAANASAAAIPAIVPPVTVPATSTSATSSPIPTARPSIAGVVAVALLFAGLGALIAGQVAQRMITPQVVEPAATTTTGVDATPTNPTNPTTTGVTATPTNPTNIDVAPTNIAPPEPVASSAEELEGLVVADPDAKGPLWELMERNDEPSRAAIARLAAMPGKVGDVSVDVVVASRSRDHLAALQAAVMQRDRARAELAINALVALRPFEALEMLDKAARTHEDKQIRAKALAARQELFRVDP